MSLFNYEIARIGWVIRWFGFDFYRFGMNSIMVFTYEWSLNLGILAIRKKSTLKYKDYLFDDDKAVFVKNPNLGLTVGEAVELYCFNCLGESGSWFAENCPSDGCDIHKVRLRRTLHITAASIQLQIIKRCNFCAGDDEARLECEERECPLWFHRSIEFA